MNPRVRRRLPGRTDTPPAHVATPVGGRSRRTALAPRPRATRGRASGDLYDAPPWTPAEAHRFLREIPTLEAAGIAVRVPDWWGARRSAQPEVRTVIGSTPPGGFGADAVLDFRIDVTLGGEVLTPKELETLLRTIAPEDDGHPG